MGMTRGTPLVATVAAVVKLTGQQDLDDVVNADSELTITDLLTTASDVIYDKIDQTGFDPTLLSNEVVYERAVAWHFLSILAESGVLSTGGESAQETADRYEAKSSRYFSEVLPKSTATDVGRMGSENLPRIANIHKKPKMGPSTKYFYDDLLDRQ